MSRKPQESPLSETDAIVLTVLGRNSSITVVELDNSLFFTGEAKREPGDQSDDSIARDLSLARALTAASQFYNHRANRAVAVNSGIVQTVVERPEQVERGECPGCHKFLRIENGFLKQHQRQDVGRGTVFHCMGSGAKPAIDVIQEETV
jgi:hypothetical protein